MTYIPYVFLVFQYFMNGVEFTELRRIFGPKKHKVTGEWRKLHNEEFNDQYCSPNIFREE